MKKKTSSATRILHNRYYRNHPDRQQSLARERERCGIAQKIYDLRKALNMSQEQFAAKIGMKPTAIARLESTDYNHPSLRTLERIAAALNQRIEITFIPGSTKRSAA